MRIRLNESQFQKLLEVIREPDLFMGAEEQDAYISEYNRKLEEILNGIEKECGWTHNPSLTKETDTSIIYSCHAKQYFSGKMPVSRQQFVNAITERLGSERVSTTLPMTINRPDNWYVKVTIKKM